MSSRPLAKFVAGMMAGLETGGRMGDRLMRHQDRRDALEVAREKNRTTGMIHRDKMGIESAKAGAYIEQAKANAQKLLAQARKASAGPAGPAGPDPAIQGFLSKYGAGVPADDAPAPATVNVQMPEAEGPAMIDPPASDTSVPEAARGGRIRGGGMNMGQIAYGTAQMVNRMRQPAPTPNRGVENTGPIGTNGPVTSGSSGPGSGFGDRPAPPMQAIDTGAGTGEVYRRGGAVRRYAEGGLVTPQEGRTVYDENGQPVWLQPSGNVDLPVNPQYGGNKFGGNKFGGQTFGGAKVGGATPGGATPGGNTYGGNTYGGWRHTETPPAVVRDPGETGGAPEPMAPPTRPVAHDEGAGSPLQTYDPAQGGGGGGGGGGRAINTGAPRGGALRDQRREKAYDPQADLYDPENIHAVDEKGMVKSALSGATAYADRVSKGGNTPGEIQGQAGGEGGGGAGSGRAQQELFSGKGAADPKMMEQVFKAVDPDNKLSMDQKMVKAIAQVHAFHTAKGDTKAAEQASFEVAQFANKMASDHGKQAIVALQQGNQQAAVDLLIKGYNFLPDGYTAAFENGNIVLKDEQGAVAQSYPMDERAMKNIALGMATGQLGWDVIRMRGQMGDNLPANPPGGGRPSIGDDLGKPGGPTAAPVGPPGAPPGAAPPAQRPQVAAQPQAAPAGPQAPPPAAPQMPAAPAPTGAAPPTPAAPPPSGAAPPRPAPQTQAQPSAAAPSPTPPPAAKTPTTPPDSASATPPGVVVGDQTPQTPQQPQTPQKGIDPKAPKPRTAEDVEREHFSKNPYAPLPGVMRTVAPEPKELRAVRAEIDKTTRKWDEDRRDMLKAAEEAKARSTVKQSRSLVDKVIAHHDKRYNDWLKTAQAEVTRLQNQQDRADSHERDTELKPRDAARADESKADTVFNTRLQETLDNAKRSVRSKGPEKEAGDKRKADVSASVARYAKDPKDLEPLKRVAKAIWMNNRKMTENEAFDAALATTSIVPNSMGANYQKGQYATTFKPVKSDLRRGTILQFVDPADPNNPRAGRRLHVDEPTYNEIQQMHRANWADWQANEQKRKDAEKLGPRALQGAKEAIKMVAPALPPFGVFTPLARQLDR